MKVLVIVLSILCLYNTSNAQEAFWESTNGPFWGRFEDLVYSPSGVPYLALDDYNSPETNLRPFDRYKLLRSLNDAESWEVIGKGLAESPVQSILFLSETLILVATKDSGVYRSDDGGVTFRATSKIGGYPYILRSNGQSVIAYTSNGLHRTFDLGDSWTSIGDPEMVFIEATSDGKYYSHIGFNDTTFVSTDNGSSWSPYESPSLNGYVVLLEANGDAIHVLTREPDDLPESTHDYITTNLGNTWEEIELPESTDAVYPSKKRFLSPRGQLYLGGEKGLFLIDPANPKGSVKLLDSAISLLGVREDQLLIADKLGVSVSNTQGSSWRLNNTGIANNEITSLSIDSSGRIFTTFKTQGSDSKSFTTVSSDEGASWEYLDTGTADSLVFASACGAAGEVYIGTYNAGVVRSTDYGNTWSPSGKIDGDARDIEVAPNGDVYTSGYSGFYYSTNEGSTWESIPNSTFEPSDIEVSPNGLVFGGGSGYNAGARRLEGSNWKTLDLGIDTSVVSIAATGNGYVIVGTKAVKDRLWYCPTYLSTDNGESWTQTLKDKINGEWVFQADRNGNLFGSGAYGVHLSTDFGRSWRNIDSGLTVHTATAFAQHPNGKMYCATANGGVFKATKVFEAAKENVKSQERSSEGRMIFGSDNSARYYTDEESTTATLFDFMGRQVSQIKRESWSMPFAIDLRSIGRGVFVIQAGGNAHVFLNP